MEVKHRPLGVVAHQAQAPVLSGTPPLVDAKQTSVVQGKHPVILTDTAPRSLLEAGVRKALLEAQSQAGLRHVRNVAAKNLETVLATVGEPEVPTGKNAKPPHDPAKAGGATPLGLSGPDDAATRLQYAQRMILGGTVPPASHMEVVAATAEVIPRDVWRALDAAGVRIHLANNPSEVARWQPPGRQKELGYAAAFLETYGQKPARGFFFVNSAACVASLRPNGETVLTVTHEAMHALDFALAKDGVPLSDQPEWKAIYRGAMEASWSSKGERGFVTHPQRNNNAQECFAECAAVFLSKRYLDDAPDGHPIRTREDLRQRNPEAFEFLRRLFEEALPARPSPSPPEALQERIKAFQQHLAGPDENAVGGTRYPGWQQNEAISRLHGAGGWFRLAYLSRSTEHLDQADRLLHSTINQPGNDQPQPTVRSVLPEKWQRLVDAFERDISAARAVLQQKHPS